MLSIMCARGIQSVYAGNSRIYILVTIARAYLSESVATSVRGAVAAGRRRSHAASSRPRVILVLQDRRGRPGDDDALGARRCDVAG